jgi:ketosteroid isomerase-like protein
MSQENVETLRAALEAWGRETWTPGTWPPGAVADMSLFDAEVAYEDTVLPDQVGEVYQGHEGVARAWSRWLEGSERLLVELEQLVEVDDRIVSIHRVQSKARHTGIEFDLRVAYLWTFRDGKIIHFRSYLDPDQAIEAARVR